MKTSITKGLRRGLQAAGVGATIAVAMGFASVGAANADTFVPLPDGTITEKVGTTTVTVTRTNESANISPSLGATPTHRNVWVTGRTEVKLEGPGVTGGRIQPGYVVGCQVNISGTGTGGATATGTGTSTDINNLADPTKSSSTGTSVGSGGISAGVGVTLSPGQAVNYHVLDLEQENAFGERVNRPFMMFKGNQGSVTWGDSTLGVTGCAGYAQARSYVKVTVDTATTTHQVTLWGQPFSIG
ncbi:MspA family porin [Rhodococcus ruber]|uniref:MspA family porin n=1 Tax=Rhodococcus ruber TaxID=1830 RepID=UPI00265FE350|nr:MspA family porin [Rhodococcus ruber]MDO1480629.1 MspA family porin [Rhodococcus ruber]